ncbi:UNVERIFIED_ORG: hypothetical protein M2312_004871 [Rhizobium esperanzae]|nr:hypothetical protein [Rhizobium esperanzae]
MFSKKPRKQSELDLDVAAHKEAIDNPPFDVELPDHRQPGDLDSMGFGLIKDSDREFFARTGSLGRVLDRLLDRSPWALVESDTALAERWAGHIGRGLVGRHYHLYFNQLRTGALVIGSGVVWDGPLDEVVLGLTFKYPFLYRYDDVYELLRLLVVQISDDTKEDIRNREFEITQALLRTLWNMRHDEAYYFAFNQTGPGTKMFGILSRGD